MVQIKGADFLAADEWVNREWAKMLALCLSVITYLFEKQSAKGV
jgi:hypothetical protein